MTDSNKIEELNQRVDQLKKVLAQKRSRTNFFNTSTLIVGLLVLALLTAYFAVGYYQFADITRPEMVLKFGKAELEKNLTQVRQTMSDEIKRAAPGWAEEISAELINGMPNFREFLEESITGVIDEQIEKGKVITKEKFVSMIEDNRQDFEEAIELMGDEDASQAFVDRIMPIMEKEYVPNMRFDAIQILGVLDDLNQRLAKLEKGENLNEIEKQQRYILGLTRTLRLNELPPSPDDPDPRQADQ